MSMSHTAVTSLQEHNFNRYLQILCVCTPRKEAGISFLPCPVPVGSQRVWPLCCWCEGSSCHWNGCLPLQAHLPLFAMSPTSFHHAFHRLLANASNNNQDFSLSLLPCPSSSSHMAPAPLGSFTDLDSVRPPCSSQAEMKQPQSQSHRLLVFPLLPQFSTPVSCFPLDLNFAYHFHPRRLKKYLSLPTPAPLISSWESGLSMLAYLWDTHILPWANLYLLFYSWIGFNRE